MVADGVWVVIACGLDPDGRMSPPTSTPVACDSCSSHPWLIVPGLVIAGAGLSLLVISFGDVVLSAVPAEAAGGASGVFSTAQQVGGVLGIAAVGTAFFARRTTPAPTPAPSLDRP